MYRCFYRMPHTGEEVEFGGRVFDVSNNNPIFGVAVSIPERGLTVRTDGAGRYNFGIIEPGNVLVFFTHVNYNTFSRQKFLPNLTSTELVVALIPVTQAPPPGQDECITGTTFCDGRVVNACVRGTDGIARYEPTEEICELQKDNTLALIAGASIVAAIVGLIIFSNKKK